MIDTTEARQHLAAMSDRPWKSESGKGLDDYIKVSGAFDLPVITVRRGYYNPFTRETVELQNAEGICYFINHAEELLEELEAQRASEVIEGVDRGTFEEVGQFLIDVLARGHYYHELTECGLKDHRAFEAQPLDEINRYYRMAEEQLAEKWPGVFHAKD